MKRSRRLIRKQRRRRKGWSSVRQLTFEPLETRQLLAVLMVNSIADTIDPQDGVVTLREAILAANTDVATELGDVGSGADEIRFDSTLFDNGPATIAMSNLGHLLIYTDLAITGPGANLLTIQAFDPTPNSTLDDGDLTNDGDGSRAFNINDGNANTAIAVSLKGLTITGGDTSGDGGGIRNKENLTISDTILRDNIADRGGAIYSENGTLTVERSVLSGNSASRWGGAMFIEDSPLFLNDSSLTNNTAVTYGGGIDVVSSALVVIDRSTISGNRLTSSTSSGGGIYARTPAGQITISNSTVSGNVGGVAGGVYASTDSGSITIIGSTISGNSAAGDGGGIYLQSNGAVLLAHSTITGNTANSDSDNGGSGGGIFHRGNGTLAIRNSIVAANIDNSGIAPDLDLLTDPPAITDIAFSLIGIDTGSSLTPGLPAASGNLIGTALSPINPLLSPLAANGGPTQTHALQVGSPASQAGDPLAVAGANGVPLFDQRGDGFPRIQNGRVDMGAIESQSLLRLSNAPGDGTLIVTVSETGEFGSNADNGADDAFFDPVGVLERLGAIFYSSVAIRSDGLELSEFLPDAAQSALVLEQTNVRVVSRFMVGPLRFVLTQELVPYFIGSEQVGSKLIQTYVITNTGTSELQFELLRYVDGDLPWSAGLNDGGGRQMVDFLETLFETDTVDSDNVDATYVGITAEGGVKPAQQRFEIDRFSALRDRILAGQGLRDAILGDVDGDQVIDNPNADIALAFNNLFVLGSGSTTQYVTTTIFGTGDVPITVVVPEEPRIENPATEPEFPGDEITGVDPRAENVTLLILIGIPVPEEFPNLNGGSGGEISAPSLRSTASSIETAEAEQALQATLQRPHEVRREELIDAVFDLGEIELVGLLGVDMGDDPVLPAEKEEVNEKPKEDQKAKETDVVPETTMLTPELQQPKAEIASAPVVAPIPDTGWQSMAFWLALAGTGTIWASGAWWWINRGRNKK